VFASCSHRSNCLLAHAMDGRIALQHLWLAPQQISMGFESWLCYCSNVVHRRPTNLCTMFGRLLGWYTIYTFSGGLWPPGGILPGANFTLYSSLAFSYIGSITTRHSTSGRQPTLRRGTMNEITELSQTAPPIFCWVAITLGVDPHSSSISFLGLPD